MRRNFPDYLSPVCWASSVGTLRALPPSSSCWPKVVGRSGPALGGFYETVVNVPSEKELGNCGRGITGITGKSFEDEAKRTCARAEL